jgi:hypothetical protein
MKDFFTRYKDAHKNPVILPALFALGISFFTVAQMRGTPIDMKNLSANVTAGLEEKVDYGADLLMEETGGTLTFRVGQDAEMVKSLYFSVLGNPSVFTSLKASDSSTSVVMNEP